jgi:CheY-like chemotaxis protein
VLCIEDNHSNLKLMEAIFENRPNITMISAQEGREGVEMARQRIPDLILLDLNLPDMEAQEILAQLQESASTCSIPIIIVSADATPNHIERLLDLGAKDYLTKPLNISQFLRTVDKFLES